MSLLTQGRNGSRQTLRSATTCGTYGCPRQFSSPCHPQGPPTNDLLNMEQREGQDRQYRRFTANISSVKRMAGSWIASLCRAGQGKEGRREGVQRCSSSNAPKDTTTLRRSSLARSTGGARSALWSSATVARG